MEYSVGQVLYCLNEKNFKIIPVQVIEEVVRTTINGKTKTYIIKFPDKNESTADIADVTSKIFTTKDRIRSYMMENTKKTIDKMLEAADILKDSVFDLNEDLDDVSEPTSFQTITVPEKEEKPVQQNDDSDIIKIDLGNGLKAKLNKNELDKVKN